MDNGKWLMANVSSSLTPNPAPPRGAGRKSHTALQVQVQVVEQAGQLSNAHGYVEFVCQQVPHHRIAHDGGLVLANLAQPILASLLSLGGRPGRMDQHRNG